MTPWLCKTIGHKWPRGVLSDAYVRIGVPTYWTVRSACQRPGCRFIRQADLAGVNPRLGIPWCAPFEHDAEERASRAQRIDDLIERLGGYRSPGANVERKRGLW